MALRDSSESTFWWTTVSSHPRITQGYLAWLYGPNGVTVCVDRHGRVTVVEAGQLSADDAHVKGSFNPKRDTLSQNSLHHHDDSISNHDLLSDFAAEYEHGFLPSLLLSR